MSIINTLKTKQIIERFDYRISLRLEKGQRFPEPLLRNKDTFTKLKYAWAMGLYTLGPCSEIANLVNNNMPVKMVREAAVKRLRLFSVYLLIK